MDGVNSINNMTSRNDAQDSDEFTELPDGSTIVPDPDFEEDIESGEFGDNLAEILPDLKLNSIASELIELIESDKKSREERDKLYEEGIKRTGLSKEAPGGADFQGASKAVHPVLAEACVDYAAATIREIFPPEGPVKMQVLSSGNSPDLIEKAENKRDFMNWQLTSEIVEYKSELEVLLSQEPLGGAQYMKFWRDDSKNRICCEYIPSDKLYLPFAASSLRSAQRFTIEDPITQYELDRRVSSGLYRDLGLSKVSIYPETTASEKASERVEGKEEDSDNVDGLRHIYEVHVFYDVEGIGERHYVISIDKYEEKILSIYRNWKESDKYNSRLEWVVEFPFIPWRGAGGIGLTHLIGTLSGAATGALRALLDSAHINNYPGAVRLKGTGTSGSTTKIGPTEIVEIEAPAIVDDIRKTIMPLPFNQPSSVLFSLLGFIVDAAKGVVSTAEEKISDATNQMPVGTAMALIEQGSKVFSSIHARQHEAQRQCFDIIQRLNAEYIDKDKQVEVFGKVLVTEQDFAVFNNVSPVSDPNIFSESQRFAQVQGILQMSQDQSVQWNKHAIYTRMLRLMHVEAPQEFLPPPPQPVSADPISEIMAAMSGQQIMAQQQMDHMSHISEELSYLLDPIFGAANPTLMNPGFQVIMQDVYQHMMFLYQSLKNQAMQQATQELSVFMVEQLMASGYLPERIQLLVQQQMGSPQVSQQINARAFEIFKAQEQGLQWLLQLQQQAAELVKTKVPPPQLDPQTQAAIQIAQMQEQTKAQIAQLKDANDKSKLQLEEKMSAQKIELEKFIESTIKPEAERTKQIVEIEKNNADNSIKSQTDLAKNLQDNEIELQKNQEDNRTQILINQMREESAREREIILEQMRRQSEENNAANTNMTKLIETILSNALSSEKSNSPSGD